jgi:hypothetical protein
MTKREKYIAIGAASAIALLLLDQVVLSPLMEHREDLDRRQATLQTQLDDADSVFSRERRLKTIWSDMQAGGLNLDASQAEGQALRSIIAWANKAGVTLSALKPEHSSDERKFQVISFNVTGEGAMPDVARLLWAMETAPIPLRVTDMQITPRKEGTDDLSARISVSALCLPPQSSGGNGGGSGGGNGGGTVAEVNP